MVDLAKLRSKKKSTVPVEPIENLPAFSNGTGYNLLSSYPSRQQHFRFGINPRRILTVFILLT
jgi:hypothetical protein